MIEGGRDGRQAAHCEKPIVNSTIMVMASIYEQRTYSHWRVNSSEALRVALHRALLRSTFVRSTWRRCARALPCSNRTTVKPRKLRHAQLSSDYFDDLKLQVTELSQSVCMLGVDGFMRSASGPSQQESNNSQIRHCMGGSTWV